MNVFDYLKQFQFLTKKKKKKKKYFVKEKNMTNEDSTTTCNSIFSVYRGLPKDLGDTIDSKYLAVQGQIMNNKYDQDRAKYVPNTPSRTKVVTLNVPKFETVDPSFDPIICPDDSRYTPTECGELHCSEDGCLENPPYVLPSLSMLLKNNLNCNITKVDPCNFLKLGSASNIDFGKKQYNCFSNPLSTSSCPLLEAGTCEKICATSYSCVDSNNVVTTTPVAYEYDGLLAPVYVLSLFKSYSFLPSPKDAIELYICPYVAGNAVTNSKCNANILGTSTFCIGAPDACFFVNLLTFGNVTCTPDDSNCIVDTNGESGSLYAPLYWVQVKLHTTNKYGHIHFKKPHAVYISAAPGDPLAKCYTPYFATSRTCHIDSSLEQSSCFNGGFPSQCEAFSSQGCGTPPVQFPPSVTNAVTDEGIVGITGGVSVDIVFVNNCVTVAQLLEPCNVFIVLLPTSHPLLPC